MTKILYFKKSDFDDQRKLSAYESRKPILLYKLGFASILINQTN